MANEGQTMLHVSLVSPERVWFEGDVDSVVAPAFDGKVGILPRHAPMVTLLGEGALVVGGRTFTVAGGFLQVVDNQVRIVTERAGEG
jgi:F-type H+-transporting ATPase subunit epsilon